MDQNRPRSREKHITGQTGSVHKTGSGLGTGPVGSGQGPNHGTSRPQTPHRTQSSSGSGTRSGGKGKVSLLAIIAALLLGGGGIGSQFLGGGGDTISQNVPQNSQPQSGYVQEGTQQSYNPFFSNGSYSLSGSSSGWDMGKNTGKIDNTVVKGARAKRTKIIGNGKDTVTLMIYMCGTDLESRSGMATSDLQEMIGADISDKVNVIVYTGGCRQWKNNVVSSSVNQVYQVKKGGLTKLVSDAGNPSMTDPATLTDFIKFCNKNFPANRNELILWDHGSGSLSGYGYDEKNQKSGSMSLAGINKALKNAGVTFDFIGFDACLMSTVETALMLDNYADYLIASEETEPGVGWYYTNWLTNLSKNTSISTVELGAQIIDDFVDVCAKKCSGQKTTLAITDLAEAAYVIPEALNEFAVDTTDLIKENQYRTVADARNQTREFAQSSAIDQVDLAHLANKIGTQSGKNLAEAILGAVKYNRTSPNMTNAYGLSVFFPTKKVGKVDSAVKTYEQIGMDDEYSQCIKAFASMEVSGQAAQGGTSSPMTLFDMLGGFGSSSSGNTSGSSSAGSAQSQNSVSGDILGQLLYSMLSGDVSGITGLGSGNTGFLSDRVMDADYMADYIDSNRFDASNLVWSNGSTPVISMSQDQWNLVHDLELNVFFDDGEGYIDLGLDNVFDFDSKGNLIGEYDGTWLAINGQIVPYYYESTVDDGDSYTITGRVPATLNGERVNLILVFDDENPYGYVAGAQYDYVNGETETIAKNFTELEEGDEIRFICDYYSYSGKYLDSYYLGEPVTVEGDMSEMEISNIYIDNGDTLASYRFTDIYNQNYWTDFIGF